MQKIVHIVAGGPEQFLPALSNFKNNKGEIFWIGVDRGVQYLLDAGIKPNLALGDFDSISRDALLTLEQATFPVLKFPAEKDQTDMEIAFRQALEQKPDQIRIFGATGGRLDHFLANISLLTNSHYLERVRTVQLIDRTNILEIRRPGKYTLQKLPDKPYVSFIPLSPAVENLTLQGFKYPLHEASVPFGSTLCISNEIIADSGTFLFTKGILLVVRSSDG